MIYLASDHGGLEIKNAVAEYLKSIDLEFTDLGTYTEESVDYPMIAYNLAKKVTESNENKGVLCCGTGIGVSIVANKVKGIRAALCGDEFSAEMTRKHNNSNVLCMGGRVISKEKAVKLAEIFLSTEFEGGRHERRLAQIDDIENAK